MSSQVRRVSTCVFRNSRVWLSHLPARSLSAQLGNIVETLFSRRPGWAYGILLVLGLAGPHARGIVGDVFRSKLAIFNNRLLTVLMVPMLARSLRSQAVFDDHNRLS